MNWFLLLLILKLFTNIWSAPIELLDAKDDLQSVQAVSEDFVNKTLNITDQANDLLKTAEDVISSTESAFQPTTLSENVNEGEQKVSENLPNFTPEVEKVLETNVIKETTETSFETTPANEENGAQVTSSIIFEAIVPQEEIKHEETTITTQIPVESSTEYVEKVLTDSGNFNSDNVIPIGAESRSNSEYILSEPAVTENVSNNIKSSMEEESVKDIITTPANAERSKETVEVSENRTEENADISTPSDVLETEQVSPNSATSLKQSTQEPKPETTTSHSQTISENLNETVEQIYDLSQKLIENDLDKSTEKTENVELATSSASNQDTTTVSYLEDSSSPIIQKVEEENKSESAKEETTNHYPEEISSETPALKEIVDSFIDQVAGIGSSIGKAAEELRYDASMIHAATENFVNPESPVVMQDNMTEALEPSVVEHEENSEQAPTFKEAVDSFIEEVVEIGSKLGLISEEKPAVELPTTTEPLSELINIETTPANEVKTDESNNSSSDFEQSLDELVGKLDKISDDLVDNKTELPELQVEDKTEEIVMTTTPALENMSEDQNNKSELVENSENSNFGRSVENLIEAASEIGSNFGKTVSNLFSSNENNQETVTDKPNEISMETTTPSELNNTENVAISSTELPVETISDNSANTLVVNHENIEVSSTTSTPNESFSYPTEAIPRISDEHSENMEGIPHESENFTSQVFQQNPEEMKPKEEEQSANYAEYIPVAVVTIPEPELESTKPIENSKAPQQLANETEGVLEPETQGSQGEEAIIENNQQAFTETTTKEENFATNEESKSENTSENLIKNPVTPIEEFTTLSPMLQETSTTNSAPVLDETTHALNKFENTLKTLIEQEKLKHEERHATSLEANQQETTTLAPSVNPATSHQEEPAATSTTTQSLDETTMLPKKFEEELQMAVKALEETTHHHFEEFQNNLKEAFKKFTVWGAEHERPETTTTVSATTFESVLNDAAATTQQTLAEQHTTMMPEIEISQEKIDVAVEESPKTEELHRSGAINQNFVDKFADNYVESPVATTTEMPMEKENSSELLGMSETTTKMEATTETPIDMTTTLPAMEETKSVAQDQMELTTVESIVEVTTLFNDVKEDLAPIAENFVKEGTAESQETITEYIAETTPTTPLLTRVSLQKDLNSVSLVPDNEHNTVAPIQEELSAQHPDSEQINETQSASTQPTEAMEEIITLPTPESSLKEMVTFIEHSDTTTVKERQEQQEDEEEQSVVTTMQTQTQEPLTQASFMEEQQQQLESTTEHDAQAQTDAAASGQTATTITTMNIEDDDTLEQETTETDIHSTTVVEEDEIVTTTTTAAPVEPEARSLSLPPPKLEYLQNEDGVEVFYGYSIVKHN